MEPEVERFASPMTVESAVQACGDTPRMLGDLQLPIQPSDVQAISKECAVLSRNYSPLRGKHQKWALSIESSISPREDFDNTSVVKVARSASTEYYSARSLGLRARIKRSPPYKAALVELWKVLNPFHLRALSKKTWLSFNAFLYSNFIKNTPLKSAFSWAKLDTDIDFMNKLNLEFQDFSTSVFEFLDSTAKSRLAIEYTRLLKAIIEHLIKQQWFRKADLHSKLHIDDIHLPHLPLLKSPKNSLDYYLTEDHTSRMAKRLSISDAVAKSPERERALSQTPRITDLVAKRFEAAIPRNRSPMKPRGVAFNPLVGISSALVESNTECHYKRRR